MLQEAKFQRIHERSVLAEFPEIGKCDCNKDQKASNEMLKNEVEERNKKILNKR